MRILITGGFGFVGGRVAQYLHQAGHQIVLGSRNASAPPNWLPQAEVVRTDWNEDRALEQICYGIDAVIQAAGMSAQDCATNPVAALAFNGLATARLVAAASRVGVKRFTYLSTAHVYANPLVGFITEDTCPRNLHPYATSHLAGENAVLSASQRRQIGGAVLRLSNAFGAPVHRDVNCWTLLVNDLCRQSIQTGKMVLRSGGLQQRDFISLSEVCRVIAYLSVCDFDFAELGVVNVASGKSQSVLEMAQLIQQRCNRILGFEPELQRQDMAAGQSDGKLQYRRARLAKIGIEVDVDKNNIEIDKLLSYCHATFNGRA